MGQSPCGRLVPTLMSSVDRLPRFATIQIWPLSFARLLHITDVTLEARFTCVDASPSGTSRDEMR